MTNKPKSTAPPSSPAPLLSRVLAALESTPTTLRLALAAELRAYIAKAKGEGR